MEVHTSCSLSDSTLTSFSFHLTCSYYYGNASNFRVVVGDHNQAVFEGAEVTLNVAKVVIHPEYHPDTNDHDLALLQLSTEISFGRTAKPVCICDDEIPDGTLCIVTGWGDTRSESRWNRYMDG